MDIDKNSQPQIDSVFQKKRKVQSSVEDEAAALWENGFKTKVAQQNFFSFGFTHYNAFTVGSVVFTAAFVVSSFVYISYRVIDSWHGDRTPSVLVTDQDSKNLLPSIKTIQSTEFTKRKTDNNAQDKKRTDIEPNHNEFSIPYLSDSSAAEKENSSTLLLLENTATEINKIEENSAGKTPYIKKEKRTILIEKRDTLEAIDTIRSKKEWRKVNKNK